MGMLAVCLGTAGVVPALLDRCCWSRRCHGRRALLAKVVSARDDNWVIVAVSLTIMGVLS